MKRLFKFLSFLMFAVVFMTLFTGCNPSNKFVLETEQQLNDRIEQQVTQILNPTFTNTISASLYRQKCIDDANATQLFCSIPDPVFEDIVKVLINKYGEADKSSIIKEYKIHQDVYDNLHPQDSITSQQIPIEQLESNTNIDRTVTVDVQNNEDGSKKNGDSVVVINGETYKILKN